MTTPPAAPTTRPDDAPPSAAPARGRRFDGVDIARALAIVGMISVHVAPPLVGTGGWYSLPYGRSSMLFALVAGAGIALSSRRGPWLENASRLLWRCLWLAPAGILLGALGTPVAVILHYYALWFLLSIPVFRLPSRALLVATAVGLAIGPTILVWMKIVNPEWFVYPRGLWLGLFGNVVLAGFYPTVSWLWVVYAGILVGRLPLADRATQVRLAVGGTLVAAAAYGTGALLRATVDLGEWQGLLDTTGHADTTLEQIASGAVAVAVLGLCLLAADALGGLLLPIVRLGRFALTVYVGHIVVYAFARSLFYSTTAQRGLVVTLSISAVSAVVATVWLEVAQRGPLEALDRGGHERIVLPIVRATRTLVGRTTT